MCLKVESELVDERREVDLARREGLRWHTRRRHRRLRATARAVAATAAAAAAARAAAAAVPCRAGRAAALEGGGGAGGLHQPDCEPEEAARLVEHLWVVASDHVSSLFSLLRPSGLASTMRRYSSSVGQRRLSRHRMSCPCPRCRLSSSCTKMFIAAGFPS